MTNGNQKVIMVSLFTKLTHKELYMKSVIFVALINIVSSLRIVWILSNTQYAPLAEGEDWVGCLLNEECYNIVICALTLNIGTLIYNICKKRFFAKLEKKSKLILAFYCFSVMLLSIVGYHTISIADPALPIERNNIVALFLLLLEKSQIAGFNSIWITFICMDLSVFVLSVLYIIMFVRWRKKSR